MSVDYIKAKANTYIEIDNTNVGYFSRKWNNNLYCFFIKEQAISLRELKDICDMMEQLNGT